MMQMGKLEALEDLEDLGEPAASDSLASAANPHISVKNDHFWSHKPSVLKLELGLELELEWQPRPPGQKRQFANLKFLMQIWPVLDPVEKF